MGESSGDLLDSPLQFAVAGQSGWEYQRVASMDLDGDGAEERAVLTSNVPMQRGRPLWEDGHHWQLYIEEPDGTRTYVYSRFVPNGYVEALVSAAVEGEVPRILLLEHTPHRLAVHEVHYAGPGSIRALELVGRDLDPGRGFAGAPRSSPLRRE